MADKYIDLGSNGLQRKEATSTSSGAGDAGKIVALNGSGEIDSTMLPTSNEVSMTCSENITAGQMINIHDSSGAKVRKASNTSYALRVMGYATSTALSGNSVTVNLREGLSSDQSGLTIGAKYYLGTAGAITTTPPTAAGTIVQEVGDAKSATELSFILGTIVENS
jgi:hypothetical protein